MFRCAECGQELESPTTTHTYEDCEAYKAKVKAGLKPCPTCKGRGYIKKGEDSK